MVSFFTALCFLLASILETRNLLLSISPYVW